MIEGFNDMCTKAGTECTGGQTVLNPWPIIGGTAMSACTPSEFIDPVSIVPGDVLVLTKPLGTQVAVNLNEWIQLEDPTKWNRCSHMITKEEVYQIYDKAVKSMTRLNRNAALLMHKYGAKGATDVTGFGLRGHSSNLAQNQISKVTFKIHTFPVIGRVLEIDNTLNIFGLGKGTSSETSGGLLIGLSPDVAQAFIKELEELDGEPAWIIGEVLSASEDSPPVEFIENYKVIIV